MYTYERESLGYPSCQRVPNRELCQFVVQIVTNIRMSYHGHDDFSLAGVGHQVHSTSNSFDLAGQHEVRQIYKISLAEFI